MNKINTIFIGTPEFGVCALQKLIQDKHFNILAVITQPDKKAGRKQILASPAIKKQAQKLNIPILQPTKISECDLEIAKLNPDIIIVIAYGQLIPDKILNIPKFGCINVHASLLPKYRGASCIHSAILNADKKTGITIMKMNKGLDKGPILKQAEIEIDLIETTETLHNKLSLLSAKILPKVLLDYINGKIKPSHQNEALASYVKILKKKDGEINCEKKAIEIECMVRALNPCPGTWVLVKSQKSKVKSHLILKILKVKHSPLNINKHKSGQLFLHNNELVIQCGKDALIIERLQLESKKAMNAIEFLKGHKSITNYQLRITN